MKRSSIIVLALAGCPAEDDSFGAAGPEANQYDDDDFPAGVCRGTGTDTDGDTDTDTDGDPCDTEGTTIGPGAGASEPDRVDACQASADCMTGVCVAPFDPDTLQRGDMTCRFECVPLLDDTAWCSDNASCCVQGAQCTDRGYCVVLEE